MQQSDPGHMLGAMYKTLRGQMKPYLEAGIPYICEIIEKYTIVTSEEV